MKSKFLHLCILFSAIACITHAQPINKSDSLALVDFYDSTNGSTWTKHTNWLTKKPVSTWFGVGVTGDRVTTLGFSSNRITGTLPSSIATLTALTSFYSYSNYFGGTLPANIGKLTNLVTLNITLSSLSGSIPASIGNLTKLTSLTLQDGKLTGAIPSTLGNCKKLTELILTRNTLSGGIPVSLTGIDSLVTLYLDGNHLTGNIPPAIGNFPYLQDLALSANDFSGSIPGTIGNLSSLVFLILSYDHLTGRIPASISNATNLQVISLSDNQLSGTIPLTMGKLKQLQLLDISNNNLTGIIPPNLIALPNIFEIDAYLNHLSDAGNLSNIGGRTFPFLTLAIGSNNFTFNTLEYAASHIGQVYYAEQAPLTIHQHGNKLAVSAGGKLSNNTYTWYKTGVTTVTTITGDSTYTPAAAGSYYATITNSVASATVLTTDTILYSIPFAATAGKISIYPNPVKNTLIIKGLNAAFRSSILVADLTGCTRMSKISDKQSTVSYDVSSLKPGNYELKVVNGNSVTALMFLKQ